MDVVRRLKISARDIFNRVKKKNKIKCRIIIKNIVNVEIFIHS